MADVEAGPIEAPALVAPPAREVPRIDEAAPGSSVAPMEAAQPASPQGPGPEEFATDAAAREATAPADPSAGNARTEPAHTGAAHAAARETPLKDRAATALAVGRGLVSLVASASALSGALEAATGIIRAIQTGLGTAGAAMLDDYGKDTTLARQLAPLASFFYEKYWRVRVEGAQNVPAGASIIVANHSGAVPFDGPVLHAALKRERGELNEARWLVEDQVFYAPFLGTLLNRLGAVRACPENAIRLLEEQRPVIVFPEGVHGLSKTWSQRYRLMRFGRGGFVKLAIRMRVPIVPVALVGAEESMPLVARLSGKLFGLPYVPITSPVPLPARWHIRFGEPILVDSHPPEAQEDLVLVNRINERTREAIQGMLEAMLKDRAGIFV